MADSVFTSIRTSNPFNTLREPLSGVKESCDAAGTSARCENHDWLPDYLRIWSDCLDVYLFHDVPTSNEVSDTYTCFDAMLPNNCECTETNEKIKLRCDQIKEQLKPYAYVPIKSAGKQ